MIRCGQFAHRTDFLHAGANLGKLKVILLFLSSRGQRLALAIYLVHETLKSAVS